MRFSRWSRPWVFLEQPDSKTSQSWIEYEPFIYLHYYRARVQAIVRGLNTNDTSPVPFRTIDVSEPGLEYTPRRATDQPIRTFAAPVASTPIEAGQMDVTATVCLRAELL
ncbi:MAG TPA: hypothetical protein VHS80_06800 [Chthoniobacterales bacterium]|nr:hypothetical protein [Chthoniobacterales bacterium]